MSNGKVAPKEAPIKKSTPVSPFKEGEMTADDFKSGLPKQFRGKVSDIVMDQINKVIAEPTLRENFRDNLLSFTSVLLEGQYSIGKYIEAVKYVSCKLLGATDVKAFRITFPERWKHYKNTGYAEEDIASIVSQYNRGKLVQLVLAQSFTPTHILNADLFQRALNKQAEIMSNPLASFKVQSDAANSLLTHLKPPENTKIELDVNFKEDDSIKELRESTLELVTQQKAMMKAGVMSVKEIAHSNLAIIDVEGEVVE